MKAMHRAVAQRRTRSVLRLVAAGSLAAALAGCYYQTEAQQNAYPIDYRVRHPITVHEGVQSVEVLIGRNRGGLTPSQRADVLAFAQAWRHEAGSGIIIDEPHGGPTDHAAADAIREIRSIFGAIGVPAGAIYVRRYNPARSALASIKLNYSKLVAEAGPCGQWPRDIGTVLRIRLCGKPALLESRLCLATQSGVHGRQPGRPRSAAGRNPRLGTAARTLRSIIGAKAKTRPAITSALTSAKSPI